MKRGFAKIAGMSAWLLAMLLCSREVLAAEGSGNWRVTYDMILLWVNFGIFAFVIIKYARTPLKNFLHGKKEEIERHIKKLEGEKKVADSKIKEMIQAVEKSNIRFADLKKRIIAQGEKRREEIIADARAHSRVIIKAARHKIDHQIFLARDMLKLEMIDKAIAMATEKLPSEITPEDNQRLLQHYLKEALPE